MYKFDLIYIIQQEGCLIDHDYEGTVDSTVYSSPSSASSKQGSSDPGRVKLTNSGVSELSPSTKSFRRSKRKSKSVFLQSFKLWLTNFARRNLKERDQQLKIYRTLKLNLIMFQVLSKKEIGSLMK